MTSMDFTDCSCANDHPEKDHHDAEYLDTESTLNQVCMTYAEKKNLPFL